MRRDLVVGWVVATALLVGCGSSALTKDASAGGQDGRDGPDLIRGEDGGGGAGGGDGRDGPRDDNGGTDTGGMRDDAAVADGGPFTPPPRCALPFVGGPCNAAFRVWASVNGACTEQIYGGCQGNENRFDTLEECLATCEGRPAARACPAGRSAARICLQCGLAGGCGKTLEVCALTCTKHEDCAAAGPRPSGCSMGFCEVYGCI